MIGGLYLCYEGAEKVWHWLSPPPKVGVPIDEDVQDAAHLEETKVRGAIKTDFILSAEIMTIALAAIETDSILLEAVTLLVVGLAITALVYGSVALIVKADDIGLHLAASGRTEATRAAGRAVVRGMPGFLKALTVVGTAAMLWVGGHILFVGTDELGWHGPYDVVHDLEHGVADVGGLGGVLEWLVNTAASAALGFVVGAALVAVVANLPFGKATGESSPAVPH
jgi:predicted DNA repair protein MutK